MNLFNSLKPSGVLLTALIFVSALTSFPNNSEAELLDLNVNNSTVYGQFLGHSFERPELSFFGGFLTDEDDNQMLEAGFFLTEPIEDERNYRPWAKIGMKALGFETENNNDGGAIAPGGILSFYIPGMPGLYLDTAGFFSPRVLSFGEAEDYLELSVRLTYQIMTAADIYLGYRRIDISLDRIKDITLDDAFHVGTTFRF